MTIETIRKKLRKKNGDNHQIQLRIYQLQQQYFHRRKSSTKMPASFFNEIDRPSGIGEDRAFQLALELTRISLNDPLNSVSEPDSPADLGSFVNPLTTVGLEEVRSKKSQNMTECVPVPSSEHVAEIVGRQGKSVTTFFFFNDL